MKKRIFITLFLALIMLMSGALAAEYTFNPDKPYDGVMRGVFNNVAITAGEATGYATYYLPDGLQPWARGAIILTPNDTTAEAFAAGDIGAQWKAVADENKIAAIFLAPMNGTWGKDDIPVINELYFTMRSKSLTLDAPFSLDKHQVALVGYNEGGTTALVAGAELATNFASVIAVDAPAVPDGLLAQIGEKLVKPFPQTSTEYTELMGVKAKATEMPVWFVNSNTANALDYFITTNNAVPAEANEYAEAVYAAADKPVARIWVSKETKDAKTIWDAFASEHKRFMAMQDGGRIEFATDLTDERFTIHEEMVNGELRRWITFVPSSYDGSKAVPLVMSIHGYTASMQYMVDETRWHDIAEKEGFIVVYPQGMVRDIPEKGNIPCAIWMTGASAAEQAGVDPMVDVNFLNAILDKTEAAYNVDKSRVYCSGHSNGSMMTMYLAANSASRFAAIAPVGAFSEVEIVDKALLPTWMQSGEFDAVKLPIRAGDRTVSVLDDWNAHNGTTGTPKAGESYDGQWQTLTFENVDGVPMVKLSVVLRTAHHFLPEQAQSSWYEFFVDYTRGEDGTLYYKGDAVRAGIFTPDTTWYAPAAAK